MHLAAAPFDLQLIKGVKLQYCKGLTPSIKISRVLVEQPFHSVLHGVEDLKQHTLKTGNFVCWERHLQKDTLQPHR